MMSSQTDLEKMYWLEIGDVHRGFGLTVKRNGVCYATSSSFIEVPMCLEVIRGEVAIEELFDFLVTLLGKKPPYLYHLQCFDLERVGETVQLDRVGRMTVGVEYETQRRGLRELLRWAILTISYRRIKYIPSLFVAYLFNF